MSVKCLICGKEFKSQITSHLPKHGLNKDKYLEMFPEATTIDKSLVDKFNGRTPWNKGGNDPRILKGKNNPFYGKKHTKECRKKISDIKKRQYKEDSKLIEKVFEGTKKGMRKKESWDKFMEYIDKRDVRGENNPFYGKSHTQESKDNISGNKERNSKISKKKIEWWENPSNKEAQREILLRLRNNHLVQEKMSEILNEIGEEYIEEYKVGLKFFDYYIERYNLLIEVDGEYWHGKNISYESANEIQKRNMDNDILKNKIAKDNGYNLERIWSKEISKEVISKIINRYNKL